MAVIVSPGRAATQRRLLIAFVCATALAAANVMSAAATHAYIGRSSIGAINGNEAFAAEFVGASADGTRVFFETSEKLVSADTDGKRDVYMRSTAGTTRISAGAINGNGADDASFEGASANGKKVFFSTTEKLVASDTDSSLDLYQRSGTTTTRVSTGAINGNGSYAADFVGSSRDGSRVFFVTKERLVGGDTDSSADIYQRYAGATSRVSAGAVNGNDAFDAVFAGASANGSKVFFETKERLVPTDSDSARDVYQRSAGTTTRVSAGAVNGNGAFDADFMGASADGSRVFFETEESLVTADSDSRYDTYQRSGGTTTRISAGAINGNGAYDVSFEGASADGSVVFFGTFEQLVGGDSDSVWDTYQRTGGVTTRVSAGAINGNEGSGAFFEGASADGTLVFFSTVEQLVAADDDAAIDIYQRSGGVTTRISAGAVNGNGLYAANFVGASADGTRVFFETNERLVATDTDSSQDIYERSGGVTTRITYGATNGNDAFAAEYRGVSTDGRRVFYVSSEQLVSSDTDAQRDVYLSFIYP